MSAGFSIDFKEQVRSRTDLVELIGESITLQPRRGGREYVGLCPFHDDHNPSLTVNPERQSYRCWVCDEGGDCFSFVMRTENVGFREALESLARRANLEMPRSAQRRRRTSDDTQQASSYDVLAWAEEEFHRCLRHGREADRAREYLARRGFTSETIAKFRVGYHPDNWDWLQDRARGKFTSEQLLRARLIGKSDETGRTYDYFVDRVMFPIRDERSRPVAFGGRLLPDHPKPDAAKYWNSPESGLFAKSRLLYGFDVARQSVRRSGTAVVMEGYTDCMMAHQYGLTNSVGTLGTSLTETHVIALKRFARSVVLIYDGDAAGQAAAERSLLRFLAKEVDLRILTLPGGMDPADYLAEHGAVALREQVDQAVEAWDYKLGLTIDKYGLESIDARQRVLDEMLDLMAQVPRLSGSIRQDIVLGRLAQRLRVDEQTIRRRLVEARRRQSRRRGAGSAQPSRVDAGADGDTNSAQQPKPNKDDLVESELLEIIFTAPQHIEVIRREVSPEDFRSPQLRALLEICYRLAEEGVPPTFQRVTLELEDAELKRQALRIEGLAREKKVALKLATDEEAASPAWRQAGEKTFLRQAIENLKWRGEKASLERSKGELAGRSDSSSGLDPNDKQLLHLISEYHRKRATKKSLT